MNQPRAKSIRRIKRRTTEITQYITLNIGFFVRARAINIGKSTRIYLGRPENVPEETGRRKQRTEKIM